MSVDLLKYPVKVKVKLSFNVMKTQKGNGMLRFHPYFWHSAQLGWHSCQLNTPVAFTLKEVPWYSFLLKTEWTPGLLNAERIRSHEKFPRALLEIETGTPCLVTQCLSQLNCICSQTDHSRKYVQLETI